MRLSVNMVVVSFGLLQFGLRYNESFPARRPAVGVDAQSR
jgi:hypothetical protein